MPQIIPLSGDASQSETILGFDLFFYWNVRDNAWRMSISQSDVLLVQGVKLVTGLALIKQYALEIGEYVVFQSAIQLTDPPRDGFTSGDFILLYYTQEEIDALLALR